MVADMREPDDPLRIQHEHRRARNASVILVIMDEIPLADDRQLGVGEEREGEGRLGLDRSEVLERARGNRDELRAEGGQFVVLEAQLTELATTGWSPMAPVEEHDCLPASEVA
jgi:hypothetical protein